MMSENTAPVAAGGANTGIDLIDAETLLKRAKLALDSEQVLKSLSFTREARNAAREAVKKYQSVLGEIQSAYKRILKSETEGVDVTASVNLLNQAKTALLNTKYDEAIALAKQSKAATKPQPLLGRDILMRTALGYENGRIRYKVEVRNQTTYPLRRVHIKSMLPDAKFITKSTEKIIPMIKPYDGMTVSFDGKLRKEFREVVDYNDIIPGRDMVVQTTTTVEGDAVIHKVRIENKRLEPMFALHIKPFIPMAMFDSVPDEHVIDKLGPSESAILIFKLSLKGGATLFPVSKPAEVQPQVEPVPQPELTPAPEVVEPEEEPKEEEPVVVAVQREPTHDVSAEDAAKLPKAPKKTIYECPKCKGPFVIEGEEEMPVVSCPWCGLEVNTGAVQPSTQKAEPKPAAPPEDAAPTQHDVQAEEPSPAAQEPPAPEPQPEPTPEAPSMEPAPRSAPAQDSAEKTADLRGIFTDSLTQLKDNGNYQAVMADAYQKLSDHLEKFAGVNKNFETFKDFEAAAKGNLGISADDMDRLVAVLDDAFYGAEGNEEERKNKAIELLAGISGALGGAAAPDFKPVEEVQVTKEETKDEKKKRGGFWGKKKGKEEPPAQAQEAAPEPQLEPVQDQSAPEAERPKEEKKGRLWGKKKK